MPIEFSAPAYSDGIRQKSITAFGGLEHRNGASDGAIFDMLNMTADEFPLAAPRRKRAALKTLTKPNGVFYADHMYYVDGTDFKRLGEDSGAEDEIIGTVADSRKTFVSIGNYIVILPDKKYYDRQTGTFGDIEAEWTGTASFTDGKYAGEDAEECRIVTTGTAFPFKAGDAVSISGSNEDGNNKTLIIRELSDDKKSLGFYEHSFTKAENQTLTLKREMPDMDFICENENRLWGCKDDTIYASKPGDPFNWNCFDGLASDSYAVGTGSAGKFTACASYLGYPIFFKENRIYKVYGSKPSDYQVMSSATLGVLTGAERTLAVAGETLSYLAPAGILAYTGGVPDNISEAFGTMRFTGGAGGSDGVRYFAALADDSGDSALYCYDTRYGTWHKQDEGEATGFVRGEGSRYQGAFELTSGGKLIRVSGSGLPDGWTEEAEVKSRLEFADFTVGSPNKKGSAKLLLRLELEKDSSLDISVSYDSGGWLKIKTLKAERKTSYYLPTPVRRCDHFRVKLEGKGTWRLYTLTTETSDGSPNR